MADTDSHAAEVRPEMLVDGAQAIVTGEAATTADLDLERRQVELVMEDGQVLHPQLVEPQRLANRAPALVHIGRGFQQQDFLATDAAFLRPAGELLLHRPEAVHLRDHVAHHEPDIMPVKGVFGSGIS